MLGVDKDMILRIKVGAIGIAVSLLGACYAQPSEATELVFESEVYSFVIPRTLIHIVDEGSRTVLRTEAEYGHPVPFKLRGKCDQQLRVRVNKGALQKLVGVICPKKYPDKTKSVVILPNTEAVLMEEDRI